MSHLDAFFKILLIPILSACCLVSYGQTTYFVTPTGGGSMDGSSWINASDNLQDMIDAASAGDQIWVATGIYKPTIKMDFDNSGTADIRETIFHINKNIALYGGFSGTETMLSERDWEINSTVLSGDIGMANIKSDNSYHVVFIDASSGIINSSCILDGFYIKDGNANENTGLHSGGGGLYLDGRTNSCRPMLHQLSIAHNSATYGGAIYFDAANGNCSPNITHCRIDSNEAFKDGGGLYLQADNGSITSRINNAQFRNNSTANYGGGIFLYVDQSGTCAPEFSNCIFDLNMANEGGAIASESQNGFCFPIFRNTTIFGNTANMNDGAINNRQTGGTCGTRFLNSILWNNQSQISNENGATVDLDHSIYDDGNANSILVYPTGVVANGPVTDLNPNFRDETNLDLRLLPGSPAINGGDNNDIGLNIVNDLDGKPRIIQGTVDMGPYESHCPLNNDPIYVDIDATGEELGISWNDAFQNIQEGIDHACNCDTGSVLAVWVAEGTYLPTFKYGLSDERLRTFYIPKDVELYGGFQGTESMLSERDWRSNEVVLSGNIGMTNSSLDNSYHVMTLSPDIGDITDACIVDGFQVMHGRAIGPQQASSSGGGIYIRGNIQFGDIDPILRNLNVSHNFAAFGGGIYHQNAQASFINSMISNDTAVFGGGGVHNSYGDPWFQNCIIQDNKGGQGGGFYHGGEGYPLFSNCAFIYNEADDDQPMPTFNGGAIFNDGTTPGDIQALNSIFWRNQDEIIDDNTAPILLDHCIFDDDSPDGFLSLPAGVSQVTTIDLDPQFLNLGSFTPPVGGRNLRLRQNSPGINGGRLLGLETNEDLDGNNRMNGLKDIGPYENPYAGCPQTLTLDNVLYTPLNGTYQAQQSIQLGSGMEILNTAQVTLDAPEVLVDESTVQLGGLVEVLQDGCTEE